MADEKNEGFTYSVDSMGFMAEPEVWNRNIAMDLARHQGFDTLTEEHWKVIDYVHEYYDRIGAAPNLRKIVRAIGFDKGKLTRLFPPNPLEILAKVAGLPNPQVLGDYNAPPIMRSVRDSSE